MPFESGVFRDHLLRLDHDGRQMRFGHAVSDEFLEKYAKDVFAEGAIVKACFIDGICRGVGEAFFVRSADCDVEAAFSIEPRWQGHGLGTLIFERLIRAVRNRGGRRICVLCLRSNAAMIRMAHKLNGLIRILPDGITGEIIRPPGGLLSLGAEMIEDAQFMYLELPDEPEASQSAPLAESR
jgi:GNAT superfamily N-acetyltransferase